MSKKVNDVVENVKWVEDKNFYLESLVKELTKKVQDLESRLDFVQDELGIYQPYRDR